jgi:hypothetical protein
MSYWKVTPQHLEAIDYVVADNQPPHEKYVVWVPKGVNERYEKFYIFLYPNGKVFIGHDLIDVIDDDLYTVPITR